jgi:D-alanine-D-alanine ligase
MNKELSKILYRQAGLKVPQALFFTQAEAPTADDIAARLGLPVVIKPVNEGSSIGVTKAATVAELAAGLKAAFAYDTRVLVEQWITGTEITGGVLGNDRLTALPLVEIIPSESYAFFDYEAKYKPGASHEICPARVDEHLTKKAQICALAAHRALQCRGYSRTDMIVKDGEVYVLETNTIPGMTATSLFPQAAKAMGLEFPQLLDKLIELALEGR